MNLIESNVEHEDETKEQNIALLILDLQHALFDYAQARQMFLIRSSRETWEKAFAFYQKNHQRQIDKILNCVVF
jgi:hypothetical protein